MCFGAASKHDKCRLQCTAEKIIVTPLPATEELYEKRLKWRVENIIKYPTHPGNCLFQILPSGNATDLYKLTLPDTGPASTLPLSPS